MCARGAAPNLAQVLAVNGDDCVAQGQRDELTQVVAPQCPLVLPLQQRAQVIVQSDIQ